MTDSKADLTFAIKQKCTFTNTLTSKLFPDFYSPGASLQGNLFRFIPHPDIQSRSNQTLILCTLLPIEPTIEEIISFDLLEEKRRGGFIKTEILLQALALQDSEWIFLTQQVSVALKKSSPLLKVRARVHAGVSIFCSAQRQRGQGRKSISALKHNHGFNEDRWLSN